MKNEGFAERLNLSLDKEGFPPKNRGRIQLLAELVGLTHRGASKWINGESCPPAKKYEDLAQKLNVDEHWLKTGEGSMLGEQDAINNKNQEFAHLIPVYHLDEVLLSTRKPIRMTQATLPRHGDFFAVSLESDAMSPRFPQGSTIIFEKNASVKDGDFVLVNYETYPTPIFRQVFITANTTYLNAHNPKFDHLILTENSQIIGRLVQAVLVFD